MDAWGDAQRTREFPGLSQDLSWKLQALLARAETAQRNSAVRLRAVGMEDLAVTAEDYAEWVRFELDEPDTMKQLRCTVKRLDSTSRRSVLVDRALDGALSLLGAHRGNVQILDPLTGSLKIAAQRGFDDSFLRYFATVDDDGSACGRAATQRAQTVIADVDADPDFAPHRYVAAASGFRAVLSTPLIDSAGRLRGVISAHYPSPHQPADRDLRIMQRYGELVGQAMASCSRP